MEDGGQAGCFLEATLTVLCLRQSAPFDLHPPACEQAQEPQNVLDIKSAALISQGSSDFGKQCEC